MKREIKKVAVLGASGTIGSLAGGLLAQNGLKVYFLSRTTAGAQKGLARAIKQARSETIAENIVCGDYDTMLVGACQQADWILECITENLNLKQQIYERIDQCRQQNSIVSTVTSSLPLEQLPAGRSDSFKRHFLATHFYNPPSRMPACEITGQSDTDPEIVRFMADFLKTRLRRTVIPVKPVPAFAGNRIAFVLFSQITQLAAEYGVEMTDYLIGPYTGRLLPPLATLDLVGLDIHKAIILSLKSHTNDSFHDKLVIPEYLEKMIAAGNLGNKTPQKGGFFKKLQSGKTLFYDPDAGDYIPPFEPRLPFVEQAKSQVHLALYRQAFQTILSAHGPHAQVVREILASYVAYAYSLIGGVSDENDGIKPIDKVMSDGFHWASPSLLVHTLGGPDAAGGLIESAGLAVPHTLRTDNVWKQYNPNAGKYFSAG